MLAKRIIPCLDVRNGHVVKGTNFEGVRDVGDPVGYAEFYNKSGADELVFYDITASFEGRKLFTDVLRRTAERVFIPLTVGGGINTVEDFDTVLKCGADKVSVNSGAIKNPSLIAAAAKKYGNQCVVLSMDVKRAGGRFVVYAKGGREKTELDAVEWARFGEKNGAGELVVNSIDTDGVKGGFDLEMLNEIIAAVNIPVVASGGAGSIGHFVELFKKTGADMVPWRRVIGIIVTFHVVCFGWIMFRAQDMHSVTLITSQIFNHFNAALIPQVVSGYGTIFGLMAVGFLLHLLPEAAETWGKRVVTAAPVLAQAVIITVLIWGIMQIKSSEIQPFIYFQF